MIEEKKTWRFQLGESVSLTLSGEQGIVIGRAEYQEGSPGYLVRYKAADGRLVESWWNEPAVVSAKLN